MAETDPIIAEARRLMANGAADKAAAKLTKSLSKRETLERRIMLAMAEAERGRADPALAALAAGRKAFGPHPALDHHAFEINFFAGRRDALDPIFERLKPYGPAPVILSHYAEHKKYRLCDDVMGMIDRALGNPRILDNDRRVLLAAKYACLDRRGAHDAAFDQVEALAKSYPDAPTPNWLESVQPPSGAVRTDTVEAPASDRPAAIFIVGLPRCGSTLIAQSLSSHERAVGVGESIILPKVIEEAFAARPTARGAAAPLAALNDALETKDLVALRKAYLTETAKRAPGGARRTFVDKALVNYRHIALIARAFPDAPIIHPIRPPLAQLFSIMTRALDAAHGYKRSQEALAARYLEYLAIMDFWDHALPGRVLHVDLGRLTGDFETGVRTLLDRMNMPFDAACLSPERNREAVRTSSAVQVREPVAVKADAAWAPYAQRLAPLMDALGGEDALTARHESWSTKSVL